MTQPDPTQPDNQDETDDAPRIAFERLRERTDELELIVSGLLAFALLALPNWLFESWAQASAHVDGLRLTLLMFGYMLGSGLSYTLGGAFLLHLAVRGYWVALIGLKASFSKGIQWDAVSTMGPVARDYYRQRLPDLMQAIDRADRAGSVLFAMAILTALMLIWAAVLLLVVALLGSVLGALVGDPDKGLMLAGGLFYLVLILGLATLFIIDVWMMKRRPELQHRSGLRRFLNAILSIYGLILPQRLILPVQLTLQSNLSGSLFMLSMLLVSVLTPIVGLSQISGSRVFALGGSYQVLDTQSMELGLLSAHYENLRGERDRLLRYPIVASDRVDEAYLRVFLPHVPERDNRLLSERCSQPEDSKAPVDARGLAALRGACAASLWTLTLNDQPVDLSSFVAAERRDLGLRGMQGYVSMIGLPAGRHDLFAVWNGEGPDEGRDERREHLIPFWLSPGFELSVDEDILVPAERTAPRKVTDGDIELEPAAEPASPAVSESLEQDDEPVS